MSKKVIRILFGLLIILGLLLSACGGGNAGGENTGDTDAGDAAAEPVHIRIFVGLGTGTDPDQVAAQEAIAEEFNSTHDDISIEFLIVPNDESKYHHALS